MTDIPAASTFLQPRRAGYLKKLIGRGWIYSGCWKRRYCVLDGTKLYFYEGERSQGNEKTAGVISLDYYDLCEEGTAKDSKRIANVFIIGTSVRGFFDNRHLFSADSTEERDEWMNEILSAVDDARSNRLRSGRSKRYRRKRNSSSDNEGRRKNSYNDNEGRKRNSYSDNEGRRRNSSSDNEATFESWLEKENIEAPDRLCNVTKYRVKGPTGRRLPQRKSLMPAAKKNENEEIERQRCASLSGLPGIIKDGESEKRKSQSMEAVIDGKGMIESICSSNTEDENSDQEASLIKQQSSIFTGHSPRVFRKALGPEQGAFLRELENKVGASQRKSKRLPPPSEECQTDDGLLNVKNSVEVVQSRMELLGTQIERVEKDVVAMRKDLSKVQDQVVLSTEVKKYTEKALLAEKHLDNILEEMHSMFEKTQEALKEAQEAKNECYRLREEFREISAVIKSKVEYV